MSVGLYQLIVRINLNEMLENERMNSIHTWTNSVNQKLNIKALEIRNRVTCACFGMRSPDKATSLKHLTLPPVVL